MLFLNPAAGAGALHALALPARASRAALCPRCGLHAPCSIVHWLWQSVPHDHLPASFVLLLKPPLCAPPAEGAPGSGGGLFGRKGRRRVPLTTKDCTSIVDGLKRIYFQKVGQLGSRPVQHVQQLTVT